MVKIITIGNRKGGVGKTTTTASLAFMLSAIGKKTLAVDMDSQGQLVQILTTKTSDEFIGKTVLEAMQCGDASPYIFHWGNNLDILPANGALATFGIWLDKAKLPKGAQRQTFLLNALSTVKDKYDYILIDTPPALDDLMVNALVASTHVIGSTEFSDPSIGSLKGFFDTVREIRKNLNPNLEIAGIVGTRYKKVVGHHRLLLLKLKGLYQDLVFKTIIYEAATTSRLFGQGFLEDTNPELVDAMENYISLLKEVRERVEA